MDKCFIMVCENSKPNRIILHAPGCALPETTINKGLGEMTKLYSMFTVFSRNQTRYTPVMQFPLLRSGGGGIIYFTPVW